MNCRKEGIICAQVENREVREDLPLRVLIEGPQGSGKSSLSRHLGTILGFSVARGFPTGDFIKSACSQEEICAKSFDLISTPNGTTASVFDRSPISQFVWEARNGATIDSCLLCSKYALEIISQSGPVVVVFIDSDPNTCHERQDRTTALSADLPALIEEVELYRAMKKYLESLALPNVQIVSIKNCKEMSADDFLCACQQTLLPIINK